MPQIYLVGAGEQILALLAAGAVECCACGGVEDVAGVGWRAIAAPEGRGEEAFVEC